MSDGYRRVPDLTVTIGRAGPERDRAFEDAVAGGLVRWVPDADPPTLEVDPDPRGEDGLDCVVEVDAGGPGPTSS